MISIKITNDLKGKVAQFISLYQTIYEIYIKN